MIRPTNPYAVYRAYDANDQLLYIGVTKNLASRLNSHRQSKWFPFMRTVRVEWLKTAREAGDREHSLIEQHKTPYNKQRGIYWDGMPEYVPVQPVVYPAFVVHEQP